MANIILYNYFRSSTSYRVRIALEFKNLTYEYRAIHLLNNGGEQNQIAYREINPLGGVPSLEVNGKSISQSMAIIEYLDEAFPSENKLFPKEPFIKAKVRQVCENINADIHPMQNLKVLQYLEKTFSLQQTGKEEWAQKWIHDGFVATEKILTDFSGKYCFGDTVTAADLFLVPQIMSAERFKLDIKKYSLLFKIYENCMSLKEFQKAHPFRQPDTPPELRI